MSGTTSLCLQQQWHNTTGDPLIGGRLYSYQAGTLTPQNAFRVQALTAGTEYPNPLILDASARVPLMFYADGLIRLVLTDDAGVSQFDYDNVPVIGSSGGGGGSTDTTDVTRLHSTGDIKLRYGTGALTGYVRGNARTIGSAVSGASELASASAQALFQYFWNTDPFNPVYPSRGASALDDWNANKQILCPDFRGLTIAGLDGMGNTRAGRLGGNWDSLGQAAGGSELYTLLLSQIPSHDHYVDIAAGQGSHGHAFTLTKTGAMWQANQQIQVGGGPSRGVLGPDNGVPEAFYSLSIYDNTLPAMYGQSRAAGGGGPYSALQPTRAVTVYFRL